MNADFAKQRCEIHCHIHTRERITWQCEGKKIIKNLIQFKTTTLLSPQLEGVNVSAQLIVHCTTSLRVKVPLVIWEGEEEEEEKELQHTFLQIEVDSKLSTRLDPDEIKLIQPPIGEGSFGTVFRGTYKTQDVAVKVLKNQSWGLKIADFHREMKIMEELRSPFIVNFIGAVVFPGRMCIVTEFIPYGSLSSLLHKENLTYLVKLRMVLDCARGMMYLHSCKIMHRDLKPDNLLVLSIDDLAPVTCKLTFVLWF